MNQHLRLPAIMPPVPSWAGGFGADRYGLFADRVLGEAVQRFRWIEPGDFTMGSPETELGRWSDEGPVHPVNIKDGFWLGDTPVTQAFYTAVTGTNPSEFADNPAAARTRPVENVSWDDAQKFIRRLNTDHGTLNTDHGTLTTDQFRLPSEAEWEYACRAGSAAALYAVPFSNEVGKELTTDDGACPNLDPLAWYNKNSTGSTQPVKGKTPNSWGLYAMLGNVWEWCEDDWHASYNGAPGEGISWNDEAARGASRVVRGGSWHSRAGFCRCASRRWLEPDSRWGLLGFRLVLARSSTNSLEPGKSARRAERGGA
jgi:formylglycine-generating enzyme required for sulfatase activity